MNGSGSPLWEPDVFKNPAFRLSADGDGGTPRPSRGCHRSPSSTSASTCSSKVTVRAAVGMDGRGLSDLFVPTAQLMSLLRVRADQLRAAVSGSAEAGRFSPRRLIPPRRRVGPRTVCVSEAAAARAAMVGGAAISSPPSTSNGPWNEWVGSYPGDVVDHPGRRVPRQIDQTLKRICITSPSWTT